MDDFVAFVLSDTTSRSPAKRQDQPMVGHWMTRVAAKSGSRGTAFRCMSDERERLYVCIETLYVIRKTSIDKAATDVAQRCGETTAKRVASIRVGFYEFKRTALKRNIALENMGCQWLQMFREWRGWVLSLDDPAIALLKGESEKTLLTGNSKGASIVRTKSLPRMKKEIHELIERIRFAPIHQQRNRVLLEEQVETYKCNIES